jgi:hypothetical protein
MKFGRKMARQTWYNWLNREDDPATMDTIKQIELNFAALAIDILANCEKSTGLIFYAKNKLGFHDKHEVQNSDATLPPITITGMEIL